MRALTLALVGILAGVAAACAPERNLEASDAGGAAVSVQNTPNVPNAQNAPSTNASPDAGSPRARGDAGTFARLYDDPSLFTRKLPPKPGDWLDRFHEPGQTFSVYEVSQPLRPTPARRKLVVLPLGTFSTEDRALLTKLEEHLGLFFDLPVERKPPVALPEKGKRIKRDGARRWPQFETTSILDGVLKPNVPDDAVVMLGVTTADLYPGESWNFVFGQARFDERIGVYSLARMFERFEGRLDTEATRTRALARSVTILAHEAGHAFGIAHCTRFECAMNGSNSLEELDRQFGEPCPVCLRKLAWNIGFDPIARYERLRDFYRREHIDELATWIDRRLARIRAAP